MPPARASPHIRITPVSISSASRKSKPPCIRRVNEQDRVLGGGGVVVTVVWFWIGTHRVYDKLLERAQVAAGSVLLRLEPAQSATTNRHGWRISMAVVAVDSPGDVVRRCASVQSTTHVPVGVKSS